MKGDDAYAHKYQNLEERSSELSAYEIVQTIIGINLLIVSVVSACIVELKKDNKKKPSLALVGGTAPKKLDKILSYFGLVF